VANNMNELIELNIDTPDGLADCRLELQDSEQGYYYEATILYPHIINGFSRSEIYCYNFIPTGEGQYRVAETEDGVHPKIKLLEEKIALAIAAHNK
jgi:hypothetical protein